MTPKIQLLTPLLIPECIIEKLAQAQIKLWVLSGEKMNGNCSAHEGRSMWNFQHVSLSSFKLMAYLRETLDANLCLESLCIEKVDVECFLDEVLLPHSVTSLQIVVCHLSSLTFLDFSSLQRLPEDGLPKSVSSLTTWECSLLKQSCQNPEGEEDWGKIEHFQKLSVR